MHEEAENHEPLIRGLYKVIRMAVRALAILMAVVILFGVVDVAYVLYDRLTTVGPDKPYFILKISDILATFGAFMAVLIAIEIFINITVYLREDVIHVRIVLATALMAIARKVIILDYKETDPVYVFATAAVALAMSIGYWIVVVQDKRRSEHEGQALVRASETAIKETGAQQEGNVNAP